MHSITFIFVSKIHPFLAGSLNVAILDLSKLDNPYRNQLSYYLS